MSSHPIPSPSDRASRPGTSQSLVEIASGTYHAVALHLSTPKCDPLTFDKAQSTELTPFRLACHALATTDFTGDIRPDNVASQAQHYVECAADELMGDYRQLSIGLLMTATDQLAALGYQILRQRKADAWDAYLDARNAGDVDEFGDYIPYDRYPG